MLLIELINILFNIEENDDKNFLYKHDELTIVSAYYKIKSKHKYRDYLKWIKNFVSFNRSMVFFTNKKFIKHLRKMRPINLHNKTVFLHVELEEFYSYKNFYNEFKKSFEIDFEKSYHSIPLYLVWAEKVNFLKKVIINNYFNSKCFYWIDAGYFRDKNDIKRYSNNWPSIRKCIEDPRLLMGQVKNFSNSEKNQILTFDLQAHNRLRGDINVVGGIFGGQSENILRFINQYYNALKLFIKNRMFIGKEQNIFTYVAFSHPEIVKLIYCKSYTEYREFVS